MYCCGSSPLLALPPAAQCSQQYSVVVLALSGLGLRGTLPSSLGPAALPDLTVMDLGWNGGLEGPLPAPLDFAHLLLLRTEVSGAEPAGGETSSEGIGRRGTPIRGQGQGP